MENLERIKKFYSSKSILITGHNGFKGSWLTVLLNYFNGDVVGLSLPRKTDKNNNCSIKLPSDIKEYHCDINNFLKVKNILKKKNFDFIFHLAAQPLVLESYKKPLNTWSTNVLGTANLLESINQTQNNCTVVVVTTDKVYQESNSLNPYSENDRLGGYDPYSSSKAAVEILTDSYSKSFFSKQ